MSASACVLLKLIEASRLSVTDIHSFPALNEHVERISLPKLSTDISRASFQAVKNLL